MEIVTVRASVTGRPRPVGSQKFRSVSDIEYVVTQAIETPDLLLCSEEDSRHPIGLAWITSAADSKCFLTPKILGLLRTRKIYIVESSEELRSKLPAEFFSPPTPAELTVILANNPGLAVKQAESPKPKIPLVKVKATQPTRTTMTSRGSFLTGYFPEPHIEDVLTFWEKDPAHPNGEAWVSGAAIVEIGLSDFAVREIKKGRMLIVECPPEVRKMFPAQCFALGR